MSPRQQAFSGEEAARRHSSGPSSMSTGSRAGKKPVRATNSAPTSEKEPPMAILLHKKRCSPAKRAEKRSTPNCSVSEMS